MDDLLEMIKQGRQMALPELSQRLGMSPELLRARLERYEQLGYVKRIRMDSAVCGGECRKCRGCSGNMQSSVFTYWERGERLK